MTPDEEESTHDHDHDVVVVGGGPSGCSAGVFTGRYGLDTVVFDRGKAALRRAAYVENYLGFPAGIGIDTLYDLMHDHVEEAGCDYVSDLVETVERHEGEQTQNRGFVVETQDGRRVTTRYVVAASWYDGEYLRPLGGEEMFEAHSHGDEGEEHEQFDPDYADDDGRTPVDGLYVVAPAGERNAQAIVAAGQGAYVARCLLEDHRHDEGLPSTVDRHYDWIRPESEFSGEWGDRGRWREWFDDQFDEAEVSDERLAELRERYIDRAFETRLSDEEVEAREKRGQRRLLDHVGDDLILERARELQELDAE